MINFNEPPFLGRELEYVRQAVSENRKLCGDGPFTKKCSEFIENRFGVKKCLLTPSCTHALEMAAILLDIQPGDEIIAPSFTFVSTVNAFVLRGARVKFIDIRPDTMNIDETLIEQAITKRTKAIVVVHYAGIGCEMDKIMEISTKYNIPIVEDAAQAIDAYYKGKALGTFGVFGTYSFHETKNVSCGEGGALLINDEKYIDRAEIIREKGTNRKQFFRGMVDKYTWVDIGSSYLLSEINAAYLCGQLEVIDEITRNRLESWKYYYENLKPFEDKGFIELPKVPSYCRHNGHLFYIKVKDIEERTRLIEYLKQKGIMAVFHYVPLHSSPAGQKYGEFIGEDKWTTKESERLLRLPMYYDIKTEQKDRVIQSIKSFFTR